VLLKEKATSVQRRSFIVVAADIPGYLIVYEGDSSTTNRHIYGRMWWPEAGFFPLLLRH